MMRQIDVMQKGEKKTQKISISKICWCVFEWGSQCKCTRIVDW